jgi:CTP:molybdopterin cytidylyltransferase MocA
VAGILLAAGDGSRLGQPKALVRIGGQTLASRGIALLQAGGADPVVIVTGAARLGPADLAPAAGPARASVITVHNARWQSGMGSSLAAGLAAVPDDCAAAILALADQPLVGPDAVRRLIEAHAGGASVAVACYEGRPRNPVLISREHWAEVAALAVGDVGARPFLRAHPDLVTHIECGDTGRSDDVDTPADLARVTALLAS